MVHLEDIAVAALAHDPLEVRSLLQDMLRAEPTWCDLPRPLVDDARVLAVAAAFAELLAQRSGQDPPGWTRDVGAVVEPIYLVAAVKTMPRTMVRIATESPEPFRRRNIFVPANYASAA